ncbi:MAG: ABC transporter ATP-binding protein [Synechococcaceae cyanobacterium SM2_3_1]|nr:ABC transporter ATP-binding protein [Synechococcaceae cyanobacterium SM2_3_1]
MLESPLTVAAAPGTDGTVLEFRQVSLQFESDGYPIEIIRDATFSLRRAEFVSIVGPSGCGKTSLLRMVSGLHTEHGGEIRFQGQPITGPLRSVGIAFQNPVLLPWRTTLQNVLLPLEVVEPFKRTFKQQLPQHQAAARELLATVGLEGFLKRYPWQLSGGMKQRASLCRALIHQPEILLLDEPFGALDAFTREDMWEMLQQLWQRTACTSLLITHDLREAVFLSDTVYVMSPRPSSIIFCLQVDLPRPRTLEMCLSDEFHHQVAAIRKHIQRSY